MSTAAPKLAEHLIKEEEERKKALEEANEYIKTHKNPTSTKVRVVHESINAKDKREPRTNPEKIEAAKKRKTQGNAQFKDGALEDAVLRYTQVPFYPKVN